MRYLHYSEIHFSVIHHIKKWRHSKWLLWPTCIRPARIRQIELVEKYSIPKIDIESTVSHSTLFRHPPIINPKLAHFKKHATPRCVIQCRHKMPDLQLRAENETLIMTKHLDMLQYLNKLYYYFPFHSIFIKFQRITSIKKIII